MDTRFAETREEATEKVRVFADGIVSRVSPSELVRFYEGVPFYRTVQDDDGNEWTEGSWGLEILTGDVFSVYYLLDLQHHLSDEIDIGDVSIHPFSDRQTRWNLWLSARLPEDLDY